MVRIIICTQAKGLCGRPFIFPLIRLYVYLFIMGYHLSCCFGCFIRDFYFEGVGKTESDREFVR